MAGLLLRRQATGGEGGAGGLRCLGYVHEGLRIAHGELTDCHKEY